MSSFNPSQVKDSPAPEPVDPHGRCLLCGCNDPREPMVLRYGPDGTRRLWCVDERACTARQDAEAAWAAQRFTITPAGLAALAAAEAAGVA